MFFISVHSSLYCYVEAVTLASLPPTAFAPPRANLALRLGWGPVFDNEIAAQADAHPTEARSKAAGNLGKAEVRAEQVGEKDRADAGAG